MSVHECKICKRQLVWIAGGDGSGVWLHVIRFEEGDFVMATQEVDGHFPCDSVEPFLGSASHFDLICDRECTPEAVPQSDDKSKGPQVA